MSEKVQADVAAPRVLVDAKIHDDVVKQLNALQELISLAKKLHPGDFDENNRKAGCTCGVCLLIDKVQNVRSMGVSI